LRSLGFEFGPLPDQEQPKVGLTVTAVSREIWFKALLEGQTEISRVWRIIAVTPMRKQDVTPKLVAAVGSKLGEITAAPTSEKTTPTPSPSPSPSPQKKP
jgi:hypothetical protein